MLRAPRSKILCGWFDKNILGEIADFSTMQTNLQNRIARQHVLPLGHEKISVKGCRPAGLKARSLQRQRVEKRHITAAAAGDYTQELADAEQRWKNQLREGRVKSVNAKTAGDLQKEGWIVLDVRPPNEVEKAGVVGSVEVPLYIPEDEVSPAAFLKKATAFGMGGWWIGGTHMKPNPGFMRELVAKVPKDSKIILGCQKGLRSLAAAEQLSRAGFGQLAWINGGFDAAAPTDLPVKGAEDLRFGGIGGLSELLGWTDVQKQTSKSEGFLGGGFTIIKAAIVVVALDGLLFVYEQASFFLNGKH